MKPTNKEIATIAQAKETLRRAVDIYMAKKLDGAYALDRRRARPICLMGPAGIGKTEIVRQVAEEKGLAFLAYSVTHHTRQSLLGLPRLVDTPHGTVTEYTMSEIVAELYRTMEQSGRTEGVLFLDEFNCCSESLRPIMLQLLQEKRFGVHSLPEGWMLVLAGNPREYNAAATDLDCVTLDRVRMIELRADYDAWRAYAEEKRFHPSILSYLDNHKDEFYRCSRDKGELELVTARSWEDLSVMLYALESAGGQADLLLISQYLRSMAVSRNFYQFYARCRDMVTSGLLDAVLRGEAKTVATLKKLSPERGWALMGLVLSRLHDVARTALDLDSVCSEVYQVLKPLQKSRQRPEKIRAALQSASPGAAQFLIRCLDETLDPAAQWQDLREKYSAQLHQVRLQRLTEAETALEGAVKVCTRAFAGQPLLEYMTATLQQDDAVSKVAFLTESPDYKKLCSDMLAQFDAIA